MGNGRPKAYAAPGAGCCSAGPVGAPVTGGGGGCPTAVGSSGGGVGGGGVGGGADGGGADGGGADGGGVGGEGATTVAPAAAYAGDSIVGESAGAAEGAAGGPGSAAPS
jgi:hypothetical protein